jgi:hypothetical protein
MRFYIIGAKVYGFPTPGENLMICGPKDSPSKLQPSGVILLESKD